MVNVTAIEIPRPSSIRLEPRICRLEELCLARGPVSIGAASIGGVVADSMKRSSYSLDQAYSREQKHKAKRAEQCGLRLRSTRLCIRSPLLLTTRVRVRPGWNKQSLTTNR